MTTGFLTYDLPLSASPLTLGSSLDAILVSLGSIDIVSIDATDPQDAPSQPTRTLLLAFNTPGATQYRAACFGDDTVDGDVTAAEAFFLANPQKSGIRLFDVSALDIGKLRRGRTLALFTDTVWQGTPLPGQQQLFITQVEDFGGIAPGASGIVAQVYGDTTKSANFTARNPTPRAAALGALCYCFRDPVSGDLLIFPSCCY